MEKTAKRKYVKRSVKWQLGTARPKKSTKLSTTQPEIPAPPNNLYMLAAVSDHRRDLEYTNTMINEIDSSFRECLCEFCFCAKLSGFTHEPLNRMYLRNNGFLFE